MPSKLTKGVEYRDCPGFPGYRVGDDGSVWSRWQQGRAGLGPGWHKLKLQSVGWKYKLGRGYHKCVLRRADGKHVNMTVHRLVLEAFVGPRPTGMQCRHLNDIKTDNRLENLAWGTPLEDARDKERNGGVIIGERNHGAKLTDADVLEIRRLDASGMPHSEIGDRFGVSRSNICYIARKKTWKHL